MPFLPPNQQCQSTEDTTDNCHILSTREFSSWRAISSCYWLMFCVCRHQQLHRKAISVVQNLLASHDVDPRYQSREAKARIAMLYVPLIGIVIDALPQLCIDVALPTHQHHTESVTETVGGDDARGIDQTVAMAIAGSSVYSIPGEASATVTFRMTLFASKLHNTVLFHVFVPCLCLCLFNRWAGGIMFLGCPV